jgi:hypothetical protein
MWLASSCFCFVDSSSTDMLVVVYPKVVVVGFLSNGGEMCVLAYNCNEVSFPARVFVRTHTVKKFGTSAASVLVRSPCAIHWNLDLTYDTPFII